MLGLGCYSCKGSLGSVKEPNVKKGGLGQDSTLDLSAYTSQFPTVVQPTSTSSSGGNFWNVLTAGIQSAGNILSTRYAVPQLSSGQYIQQTPQGNVMYQLAPGQSTLTSVLGTGSTSSLVLLAVAGIAAFALFSHH